MKMFLIGLCAGLLPALLVILVGKYDLRVERVKALVLAELARVPAGMGTSEISRRIEDSEPRLSVVYDVLLKLQKDGKVKVVGEDHEPPYKPQRVWALAS